MYGIQLRRLRLQRGLTQRELGALCGLSATSISMMERGERLPGRKSEQKLRLVLGTLPARPPHHIPTVELLTLLRR